MVKLDKYLQIKQLDELGVTGPQCGCSSIETWENYSLGSYHPESTQSHLISEAKLVWAWLVLGWERELQLDNQD